MSNVKFVSNSNKKKADLLIIGFFKGAKVSREISKLEPAFSKTLQAALEKKRFEGSSGDVFKTYSTSYKEAPEIIVIGLGDKKKYNVLNFRKIAGKITPAAKGAKAKNVRVVLDTFISGDVTIADAAGVIQEIQILSNYRFDTYKSKPSKAKPASIELLVDKTAGLKSAEKHMAWNEAVAEGALFSRMLINEPGNVMNPKRLVEEARKLSNRKKGLTCKVLAESELKRLKMNGILAVNQGSYTPPAMIILEYGTRFKNKGTVCLVGKGVTFDTGGTSIKPGANMEKMKYDMSGAAAVIGTMSAVADFKPARHVIGIVPTVENHISNDPQRPGDIIKMYNGKTVEVINTDAEGRLILADALSYCAKYKPKHIIDLATLTGMCLYTFGDKCAAVLGTDPKLVEKLKKVGEESGERCWELPLYDEYRSQIVGHHSDLLNVGGTYGGTITAAMFLKEFVPEKTSWAHLDIAGMAWANSNRFDCVKGGTGYGVKLLSTFLSK